MYTEKSLKHRKDPQIRSEGWRNYLFKPRKGTGTWESCGLQYFTEGAHQLWKSDRKSWGKKGCYYVLFFSDALFFSFFLSLFLSFFLFLSLFVCSQDKFSLCSPRCPGTHSVDKMALNSQKSACLCLLNAGIKGKWHHWPACFWPLSRYAVWDDLELLLPLLPLECWGYRVALARPLYAVFTMELPPSLCKYYYMAKGMSEAMDCAFQDFPLELLQFSAPVCSPTTPGCRYRWPERLIHL